VRPAVRPDEEVIDVLADVQQEQVRPSLRVEPMRAVPQVARWSVALGIAWVTCYVALAVWQVGDPAALVTDVGLALFGAAAVVVGRRPAVAAA